MTSVIANPIDFEQSLNPEQLAAVTHGDGPQLVIAGAGSGKTRVITYRIAWLIQERGVDPRSITAVTFTNKAAGEMRERVERLVGVYPLRTFVGTFHRFALILLRRYGERVGLERDFVILDADDQKRLVRRALERESLDPASFPPRTVLAAISSAKNRLLDAGAYEREADDFYRRRVARVYRQYQKLMMEARGVDFDDMIRLAVRLLDREEDVRERVRRGAVHLLVDEFQDTNHAQMRLIHALVGDDGNLTAVGDEDQGIYRWRGAELENILRFERSFPDAVVRKLERNYRSTQTILDASGALVANNEGRRGKNLWTDAGDGEAILLYRARDELDEASWIARTFSALRPEHSYSEMAVLVRTNAQTRALEDAFLRRQIPYSLIAGVRFYERAEIKDLIAYLRLLRNPRDPLSFNRVLNKPSRGIGKRTHQRLLRHAGELDLAPWDVLVRGDLGDIPQRSAQALTAFRDMIHGLIEDAETMPLPKLIERVLAVTGYAELYNKNDPESEARRENVAEFLSAAQEFVEQREGADETLAELLTAFLDHVSLTADVDSLDPERGVSIMTLHSAKGLEFPTVVVAGLEDGLLPHFNAQHEAENLEEERRLLYVGMTRAEKLLALTTCRRRRVAGRYQERQESPFLLEIPQRFLAVEESPQLFAREPQRSRQGRVVDDVYSFFKGTGDDSEAADQPATPVQSTIALPGMSPPSPAPASLADLRKGSQVRHPKLGKGRILNIEGSGDNQRLVVYFEGYGRRKLVARYAKLDLV